MGYASQADMAERFGETELAQLTAPGDATAPNAATIVAKLEDADAEIDGYLQARYALPLPNPPLVLKRIACDIARYHLYDDRWTEQVRQRYLDAIAWLKDVAKGMVGLGPVNTDNGAGAPVTGAPAYVEAAPTWTRETLREFYE